jgi:uridine kinase
MHRQLAQMRPLLVQHCNRYPQMTIQDLVKLLFQSEFAGGHMISSEQASLQRLQQECRLLSPAETQIPMFEDIGNRLCRLHLMPLSQSRINLETVNRFFVNTARTRQGQVSRFEAKLELLRDCCREGLLPFSLPSVDDYLRNYREEGYPAVSHSLIYRETYRPAYRVVGAEYRDFFPLFSQLDQLLQQGRDSVTVAIDGHSGAGKSTLAAQLKGVYDCNVFHMDDFFLPPQLRTRERLAEAGGNVHYERFRDQIIAGISAGREFSYQPYDCRQGGLKSAIPVTPTRLNVVEGVYSLHPALFGSYQLRVFLTIDRERQLQRIAARSGAAMLQRFIQEWIPLEDYYFQQLQIAEQCDLVFAQ